LDSIDNPRDKFAVLAVKEQRWKKEQQQIRVEAFNQQKMVMEEQGKNMLAGKEVDNNNAIKQIYAKGDVQAKITELAHH